ncbi:DNA polymerase III, subunit gamma and tau [Candidatus Nomurabacteria bacterium RIFCSPHIGHO2_01_FULL_39_9]|uniref:DNA polymerase III subunit gamma/tau n=1 Tax=Candidatus Nomurabacteria bacterium RIFCSPHIGHO2_01_FULL_39_9 TaxID=1801735 RepID=A0A1F6UX48_9BACT|nr:MAG: DNA polymerase III, subunit gamma and tau [Candidatus Nomurabacteria bacterium RIFCSPHIGHO2_01_FULL_39_9]
MTSVLYRKYRPTNFKEVLGQEHITGVLEKSLEKGDFAHAYLFCGSRGTGKTSIARIFAKELGVTPSDVYEIDAASNRGIDDIRELREGVATSPFESKYKIYIIDEVHMLTKEAFNALLKTLEEPPAHVVFVLATTEMEKVPETIISRCVTYNFKKPTEEILKKYVIDIAEKENLKIDNESADLIALLGEGSFRDTCGILQKLLSLSRDKKISREEVEAVTGAPKTTLVNDFILAIAEKDFAKGLNVVEALIEQNVDVKVFVKLLLHKLRLALILRYAPELILKVKTHLSEKDLEFIKKLVAEKNTAITSKTLEALLECYQNLNVAYIPTLPLELALSKMVKE